MDETPCLAFKINKNWLFSLETGKHKFYLCFHFAYLYIHYQNWSKSVEIGYFYSHILKFKCSKLGSCKFISV